MNAECMFMYMFVARHILAFIRNHFRILDLCYFTLAQNGSKTISAIVVVAHSRIALRTAQRADRTVQRTITVVAWSSGFWTIAAAFFLDPT